MRLVSSLRLRLDLLCTRRSRCWVGRGSPAVTSRNPARGDDSDWRSFYPWQPNVSRHGRWLRRLQQARHHLQRKNHQSSNKEHSASLGPSNPQAHNELSPQITEFSPGRLREGIGCRSPRLVLFRRSAHCPPKKLSGEWYPMPSTERPRATPRYPPADRPPSPRDFSKRPTPSAAAPAAAAPRGPSSAPGRSHRPAPECRRD
jgi:hypothetical protein